jgi:blocked-early-in-transport protein 1
MASRFQGQTSQRQRLFASYDASRSQSQTPPSYGYERGTNTPPGGGFSAYPANGSTGGFRSATPDSKGRYSDAVLSELESQNDDELSGIQSKVKRLKDMTIAIGDEIRDSTSLANTMNDTFEASTLRLKNTMNRMLRMAEKTGISWKAWLGFFTAVILLFWYIWIF